MQEIIFHSFRNVQSVIRTGHSSLLANLNARDGDKRKRKRALLPTISGFLVSPPAAQSKADKSTESTEYV